MEAKQARLRREERDLRAHENTDVPRLTREDCESCLADLRDLQGDEVHTAAPILHAILGDVVVEQQDIEGFKKPQWIAKFTLYGQAVVSYLTQKKDYPDSGCWELRTPAVWTIGDEHEVWLREVPKYEQIAEKVLAFKREGRSTQWIAEELEVTWKDADDAIRFAETGKRPEPEKPRKRQPRRTNAQPDPKYKSHAAEVVRLRDEERWSFPRIARHLRIHESTATRAYDFGTRGRTRSDAGKRNRGCLQHLNADGVAKGRSILAAGANVSESAKQTSLSMSTIHRLRRK